MRKGGLVVALAGTIALTSTALLSGGKNVTPPGTMGKDLGYGLWKVLEYETDAEYSRELLVRGLGLQAR